MSDVEYSVNKPVGAERRSQVLKITARPNLYPDRKSKNSSAVLCDTAIEIWAIDSVEWLMLAAAF